MTAPIHILTGCTACGKSELALAWAERVGAEIVSCDSLLFYRGMDIGTAKPSSADRARVTHHLIDIVEVDERIDVKRYADLARLAVEDIERRGHPVLVTGGSGFYLKSFLEPVADGVEIDAEARGELEARLEAEGLPALVAQLRGLNPDGLGGLDTQNPRRVLRALERCLASGATLAELAVRFAALEAPYANREFRIVEIAREPEMLRKRIHARVRTMLESGLVEEVRTLRGWGLETNPSAAGAIGYRETLAWLDEGGDMGDLEAAIARNTCQLARKQRTWFRTQLPEHRVLTLWEGEAVDLERLFEV